MLTAAHSPSAPLFRANVALVLPAATVTLAGTLAAPLLLESATCAPPAGAGPLSFTVPVEDCVPPMTLVGFSASEETVGGGGPVGGDCSKSMMRAEERRVGAGGTAADGLGAG